MGKQTIIRAARTGTVPYFSLSRSTAQDAQLSFEARGMLVYLLSKPGDWRVTISDLMSAGNCGRDRVYRILKELGDTGYVERRRSRTEKGTLIWGDYLVYEVPHTENTEMDAPSPLPEKPYTEKPYLENTDVYIKESSTEEEIVQIGAVPKNGTAPTRAAKPKTKNAIPPKSKPAPKLPAQRPRDHLFDTIAECSFGIPVGAEVGKVVAGRIGMVRRELLTTFPDIAPEVLRSAYAWHTGEQKLTAPSDAAKVVTMLGAFLREHPEAVPAEPVEMEWHEPEADYAAYYSPEAMQARAAAKRAEMMGVTIKEQTNA